MKITKKMMKHGGDRGGKMTGKRPNGIGPRNGKETKKNIADLRCGCFDSSFAHR